MSWCTAMCRQRINAMAITPYDLFSWNKRNIRLLQYYTNSHSLQSSFWISSSLCARWSFFIMPDSSFLLLLSPCCLLPCWALTAYLPYLLGAGPSLTPSTKLTPFPSGPRQRLALMSSTLPLPGGGELFPSWSSSVHSTIFRGRPLPL